MYFGGVFFIWSFEYFIFDSDILYLFYLDIMYDKLSIFILLCINFDDISKNILFIDKNVKYGYELFNVLRGVENLFMMFLNF